MTLLKIADIHTVNILSFVNECRAGRNPDIFKNYFTVSEATYDFRHKDRLFVPLARIALGSCRCAILGAKLWKNNFDEVNQHLFKKLFRKRVTKMFYCKIHSIMMLIPMSICACIYIYIFIWVDIYMIIPYLCVYVMKCKNNIAYMCLNVVIRSLTLPFDHAIATSKKHVTHYFKFHPLPRCHLCNLDLRLPAR